MMDLFKNKARYTDFDNPYERYLKRSEKSSNIVSKGTFINIIRSYCKRLADELESNGYVDLPLDMGSLSVVRIAKRPMYNRKTKKYILADTIDWSETKRSGSIVRKHDNITFGICFVPKRVKGLENFRAFGIVANRQLFRRMKKRFDNGELQFYLPDIETYL